MIALYLILLFFGLLALIKISDFLIKLVGTLGVKIRIPRFILSSVFLAIATASPEFFVGLVSAINKKPIISLSNVLGSGMADLTLVTGLAILIGGGLYVKKKIILHELFLIFILAILPFALLLDRNLSFFDGLLLILAYIGYNVLLIAKEKHLPEPSSFLKKRVERLFLEFILGLLFLTGAAQIVVYSAEKVAELIKIPLTLVGFFLLALGTTLPELILESRAAKEKEPAIFFGDVFGSVVAYITGILGMVAIISPIKLTEERAFLIGGIFILISLGVLAFLLGSGRKLTRKDGAVLVALYLAFVLVEIFAQ